MRMRQTLADFEAAFHEETAEEQARRARLRRQAAERSRTRRVEKVHKGGNLRFAGLVLALLATTIIVVVVMFQALALLMSP